jgi:hypothetical protein
MHQFYHRLGDKSGEEGKWLRISKKRRRLYFSSSQLVTGAMVLITSLRSFQAPAR